MAENRIGPWAPEQAGQRRSAPAAGSAPGAGGVAPDIETVRLLTRAEAAGLLKVSVSAVRKWQREGRLPTVKLGTSVRIPLGELRRFVRDRTVFLSPQF